MTTSTVRKVAVGMLMLSVHAVMAAEVPVGVSPGSASGTTVESRCPTFIWGQMEGANRYELVVYRIEKEGEEARAVLEETLPGSVNSWTPPLDRCFERTVPYAWVVRAVGRQTASEWSAPNLFRVAESPTEIQVAEALSVLRRFLAFVDEDSEAEASAASVANPPASTDLGSFSHDADDHRSVPGSLQPAELTRGSGGAPTGGGALLEVAGNIVAADPAEPEHLATKGYVDAQLGASGEGALAFLCGSGATLPGWTCENATANSQFVFPGGGGVADVETVGSGSLRYHDEGGESTTGTCSSTRRVCFSSTIKQLAFLCGSGASLSGWTCQNAPSKAQFVFPGGGGVADVETVGSGSLRFHAGGSSSTTGTCSSTRRVCWR